MQLGEIDDEQNTKIKFTPYVRCYEGKIKAGKKDGGVGRCAILNWMLSESFSEEVTFE